MVIFIGDNIMEELIFELEFKGYIVLKQKREVEKGIIIIFLRRGLVRLIYFFSYISWLEELNKKFRFSLGYFYYITR